MTTEKDREASRLRNIAKEYELKGYKVTIQPSSDELPSTLATYSPDAIASSDAENVLIEVKSSSSMTESPYLTDLAASVEALPNWRFELVVTNPREFEKERQESQLLSHNEISERIAAARQLAAKGNSDMAFLMAWTAIESMLRRIAAAEGMRLSTEDSRRLVKELYSRGVLNDSRFRTLDQAAKARNHVAHGFRAELTTSASFDTLLNVAYDLLTESR